MLADTSSSEYSSSDTNYANTESDETIDGSNESFYGNDKLGVSTGNIIQSNNERHRASRRRRRSEDRANVRHFAFAHLIQNCIVVTTSSYQGGCYSVSSMGSLYYFVFFRGTLSEGVGKHTKGETRSATIFTDLKTVYAAGSGGV